MAVTHISFLHKLLHMHRAGVQWQRWPESRAPQIVAAVAVVGIAWQMAQLTWLLVSAQSDLDQAPGEAASLTAAIPAQHYDDVAGIAAAHLFGVTDAAAGVIDPLALPVAQTTLVLAGTMVRGDPSGGFAIIGENAAGARFYRVGDAISGGARLHMVYADRVILERGGMLESLLLPRTMQGARIVPQTASIGGVRVDMEAVGDTLQAQAVMSNDDLRGYRVYPGADTAGFAQLGLRPGDLITLIDGNTLEHHYTGNTLAKLLMSGKARKVTVVREEGTIELTIALR